MKCKYGEDNMVLSQDECIWHCPHCGYEQFAPRTFYNQMKKLLTKKVSERYKTKEDFIKTYDPCVSAILSRVWDKVKK